MSLLRPHLPLLDKRMPLVLQYAHLVKPSPPIVTGDDIQDYLRFVKFRHQLGRPLWASPSKETMWLWHVHLVNYSHYHDHCKRHFGRMVGPQSSELLDRPAHPLNIRSLADGNPIPFSTLFWSEASMKVAAETAELRKIYLSTDPQEGVHHLLLALEAVRTHGTAKFDLYARWTITALCHDPSGFATFRRNLLMLDDLFVGSSRE